MSETSGIDEKKINDVKIQKIIDKGRKGFNAKNTQGYDIVPDPWANIGIVSKKKTGKSTVTHNILKKVAHKNATVLLFVSTVHKDPVWKKTVKMLEDRGCNVESHTHFIKDGVNLVDEFLEEAVKDDSDSEDGNDDDDQYPFKCRADLPSNYPVAFHTEEYIKECECKLREYQSCHNKDGSKKKPKGRKKKILNYARFILVFDDLSTALRHKSINQLAKIIRHPQALAIYSSQRDTDFHPDMWGQMDFFLCFRSLNEKVIDSIWAKLNLSTELEDFKKIYEHCTEKPYDFLYVDVPIEKYRCKFDVEVNLK
jgi:hypothetical protein